MNAKLPKLISADYSGVSSLMIRLLELINRHAETGISLREAALICNLSRYHLCRRFRAEVGMTFSRYRTITRLTAASELLKKDLSLSVTQVCYACGYSDLSNFLKAFKRQFGCSPKKYRSRFCRRKHVCG